MSIFGDIADAVGGAADWVGHAVADAGGALEGVVSDVVKNPLVTTGLNFAGGLFGDPNLGNQAKGALGAIDKLFGKGSTAAGLVKARTTSLGHTTPGTLAPNPFITVKIGSRRIRTTKAKLSALIVALQKRSPGRGLLAPPVVLTRPEPPPPPPPPQTVPSAGLGALLANPDAVTKAVENGTPLSVGGKTIDVTQPIYVPPSMSNDVRNDLASMGLIITSPPPPPREDDVGPGGSRHGDF